MNDLSKLSKSEFQLEVTITRKKKTLPRGITYEEVVTERKKTTLSEEVAYTHFFPHGMIEQTLIYLKNQSQHMVTLELPAVGGVSILHDGYVNANEIFKK